jgi:DNA-binding transcriptional regulator GbsR (MarR family)
MRVSAGLRPGNVGLVTTVPANMTPNQIHDEIERISEVRQELWHQLSDGLDPAIQEEIRELDTRLEELWQTLRMEKARLRFGEREDIVRRARAEERLERAA